MIISQHLASIASTNLAKPAFRYIGKDITYRELKTKIAKLSYLYQKELPLRARVAFLTGNSPAVFTTFIALSNIRVPSIPLDPKGSIDDILSWIKETRVTHIAVTSDLYSQARQILDSVHLRLPIIEIERKQGGEYDAAFIPAPDNQPTEIDPILLLRTAGTTGVPKFAVFSHKQLIHASTCIKYCYRLVPGEAISTFLNWSHPFAWVHSMLFPVMTGSTCVVNHTDTESDFLKLLKHSRATRLVSTPEAMDELIQTALKEKKGIPPLKSLTLSLGSLNELSSKTLEKTGIPILTCYGQTENLWTVAMDDLQTKGPAFVGVGMRGLPGCHYKVLDENGDEIPMRGESASAMGQLAISGPSMMMQYFEKEKATREVLRGTWLYTGDVVRLEKDADNTRITYLGRKLDLHPLAGGQWLTMKVIDRLLLSLPGVRDAATFSVDDANGKRKLVCAIIKAEDQSQPITEQKVIAICKEKLPSNCWPSVVVLVESIPKDIGKNIHYTKLRAQFAGIV